MNDKQQEIADRIRAEAPGEILSLVPDVEGFLVIQKLPEEHNPMLYRVALEKQINGEESLHWALLGPVNQSDPGQSSG